MIPKTQTFDNSKKGLLNASRGMKEPQRPKKYRRGSVANSGASLQPERPDPHAGRQASETSKFLGQMQEFIFGKGMVHEQYREAEKERGIATWEKATVDQREGFEKAIKNGWINSKESPYFRESVTNAYTDNLVHKASLRMWTDYEKWPDKNNPNSGSLQEFFQQQEDTIAINLESIPDETLKNRFYEQWQAQKRELTRKHANHLNAEYNAKAQDEIDNKLYNLLEQYDGILDKDYRNTNSSLSQMLDGQRYTRDNYREIGRLLETIGSDGRIPDKELENLKYKAVSRGGVYLEMYEDLTGNIDARAIEPIPSKETEISSQDIEVIAEVIAPIKNRETKVEVEKYLEEVSTHAPLEFAYIPVSPRETAAKQIEFQKIIAKKPTVGEGVVSSMIIGLKDGSSAVAVAEHSSTTKGGPLISKGGGANGTLPVFLATSDNYDNPDVQEFSSKFALSLEKQRTNTLKIWHSYLDTYYSGKKGAIANIWKKKRNTKEKWFVGNWKEANFNVIHFKSYVESLEEEGSKT